VCGTMHKQKDMFFFMLQSEYGDLYKVTLQMDDSDKKIVKNLVVSVFDSIAATNSLCITRSGLLFAASEFSNHGLFQFQGLGDDINLDELADESKRGSEFASDGICAHARQGVVFATGLLDDSINEQLGDDSASAARVAPVFTVSAKLKHLSLVDDVRSLAPITETLILNSDNNFVSNNADNSYHILALCGRGHRSSARILKQGARVSEMAVSELPAKPLSVWTIKQSHEEAYDKYIVVSLPQQTLVLSIGDTVEEVIDSGFLTSVPTLMCVLLGDNSVLQVYAQGIRHIRTNKQTHDLKMSGRRIEKACANTHQLVISLAGGELAYFELDAAGVLREMCSVDLGKEVSAIDMGTVPAGRVRSSFLAVACWDDSVVILSLEPTDLLTQRTTMTLSARAESVCLVEMNSSSASASGAGAQSGAQSNLYLSIGLSTGVLVRLLVDQHSGSLTDFRQRFLGSRAIKLNRISINNRVGVMALSSKAWLIHNNSPAAQSTSATPGDQNTQFVTKYSQLNYDSLDCAHTFRSEQCPEGIVCVAGNTLRIIVIENIDETFNQQIVPLRYTPRRACKIPNTPYVCILESDHNEYTQDERARLPGSNSSTASSPNAMSADEDEGNEEEVTVLPVRGPVPPSEGHWASCVRIFDPSTENTLDVSDLNNNECATCVCTCKFQQHSEETFLVIGTVRDMHLQTRKFSAAAVHVYRLLEGGAEPFLSAHFDYSG
jgi:splicing factor 3B subunit 3